MNLKQKATMLLLSKHAIIVEDLDIEFKKEPKKFLEFEEKIKASEDEVEELEKKFENDPRSFGDIPSSEISDMLMDTQVKLEKIIGQKFFVLLFPFLVKFFHNKIALEEGDFALDLGLLSSHKLYELTACATLVIDKQGEITIYNKKLFFRYDEEEAPSPPEASLSSHDDVKLFLEALHLPPTLLHPKNRNMLQGAYAQSSNQISYWYTGSIAAKIDPNNIMRSQGPTA